jgi:hypothetical protein
MALTRAETDVVWSAAVPKTLTGTTRQDSDAFTFDATDVLASVQVNADNAGTPAGSDYVDVYWKQSNGDVLGDSGDDFDTDEHALYLGRLDTVAANTPGEDPARRTWAIPTGAKAGKLSVVGANAATRNIVIRARIHAQRAA